MTKFRDPSALRQHFSIFSPFSEPYYAILIWLLGISGAKARRIATGELSPCRRVCWEEFEEFVAMGLSEN
jgi:hypothetical protein